MLLSQLLPEQLWQVALVSAIEEHFAPLNLCVVTWLNRLTPYGLFTCCVAHVAISFEQIGVWLVLSNFYPVAMTVEILKIQT